MPGGGDRLSMAASAPASPVMQPIDPEPFLAGHDAVIADGGGWWRIHRLPAGQRDHLARTRAMGDERARCPAGVRLRLRGRLRAIRVQLRVEVVPRPFAACDLLADGQVVAHVERDGLQRGDEIAFTLVSERPERDCAYELWLPVTVGGPLAFAVDADGAPLPLPAPRRRLLAIGDSITQGMVCRGPAGTYAALIARALDADLRNHGIGGHWFDPDLVGDTGPWRPDVVTIAYGTNDWSSGATPAGLRDAAASVLARVRERHPGTPIALITPLWREDGGRPRGGGHDLPTTAATLVDLAGEGVVVIDGLGLLPHHRRFTGDGLHPDDLGMQVVATQLLPRLRPLLG